MRPATVNAKRRNLTISDADYAWLQKLGGGNASKGVRVARELIESTNCTPVRSRKLA